MLAVDDGDTSSAADRTGNTNVRVAVRCGATQTLVITCGVPGLSECENVERVIRDGGLHGVSFITQRLGVQPSDCHRAISCSGGWLTRVTCLCRYSQRLCSYPSYRLVLCAQNPKVPQCALGLPWNRGT